MLALRCDLLAEVSDVALRLLVPLVGFFDLFLEAGDRLEQLICLCLERLEE
jgi:hypothetical protein